MAVLRKKVNPARLMERTGLASKTLYDGIESGDFIINTGDANMGGIVRKQPHVENNSDSLPYPSTEYAVSLEGDTGDIVEFAEISGVRDEIGVGTFAAKSTVYGTIGADLKVVITDVSANGLAVLGTVVAPLHTDTAGNKFVWVRLAKSGVGFATVGGGSLTLAEISDLNTLEITKSQISNLNTVKLSDLADVNMAGITNNDTLKWDAATSKMVVVAVTD